MRLTRWRPALLSLCLCLLVAFAHGQVTISGSPQETREPPAAPAAPPVENDPEDLDSSQPLANQVEDLKAAVLDLSRDLLILEEELLYPANTQIAVFLSMDVGEFFQVDAVQVKIDDELVASSLYTPQQADALFRGGVQRIYIGNLKSGSHVVTAFFTGKGPEGRDYKRGATTVVEKALAPKMLELRITDSTRKLQPVFDIKEWEL